MRLRNFLWLNLVAALVVASALPVTGQATKPLPTGIVKSNPNTGFTAASPGVDYLAPNGSGAALTNLPTSALTGTVAVANGGTGATAAATSRINLGLGGTFPVSDYMTASRKAGTGAGTIDDSGAWIACWAACTAAGGGEIVVDRPLWLLGGTDIPGGSGLWDGLGASASNIVVRGRGDATPIKLAMAGKYLFALANWNMAIFKDLVIVPKVDNGTEACYGVFYGYARKTRWERCTILGVRSNGPTLRFTAGWNTLSGCDTSGCGTTNGPASIVFDDAYGRLSDHMCVDLGYSNGVQYSGGRNTTYPWVKLLANGTDGTATQQAGDQVALIVENSYFDEGAKYAVEVALKNPSGPRIKQVVIENTSGNAMVPLLGVYSVAGVDLLRVSGGSYGWNIPTTFLTLRNIGVARLERLNANMQVVPAIDADATVACVEISDCSHIARSAGYAALRTITRVAGVTTYEPDWPVTGNLALTGGVAASTSVTAPTVAASTTVTAPAIAASATVTAPTVAGGTASGGDLSLLSTTHATKGKIRLGVNSAYDGVNGRLGLGTDTPLSLIDTRGTTVGSSGYAMRMIDSNATHGAVFALGYPLAPAGEQNKAIFADATGLHFGSLPDALNASPSTAVTVKTNGNVGIGFDPTVKLDVNGDVRLLGTRTLSMTDAITYTGTLSFATNAFTLGTNGNIPIRLNTAGTDRLTVGGTGAVSIPSGGSLAIGAGTPILKVLSATATLDFPSTAAQTSQDLTITVTGAAVGDGVQIGLPASVTAGTSFMGWVSAPDTCTIRHNNYSAGAIDPASATFRAAVTKF